MAREKLFFTADVHLGHKNIIKHDNRPFSSVEEMDKTLIHNWNSVVGENDRIWCLGDLVFRSEAPFMYYLSRLNGHIHFIRGNHDDSDAWKNRNRFHFAAEAAYIKFYGQKMYLLHYPCREWRGSHRGSWHIHGHCHGNLPPFGMSVDVGVTEWNYMPVEFEQIAEYMRYRKPTESHREDR